MYIKQNHTNDINKRLPLFEKVEIVKPMNVNSNFVNSIQHKGLVIWLTRGGRLVVGIEQPFG